MRHSGEITSKSAFVVGALFDINSTYIPAITGKTLGKARHRCLTAVRHRHFVGYRQRKVRRVSIGDTCKIARFATNGIGLIGYALRVSNFFCQDSGSSHP